MSELVCPFCGDELAMDYTGVMYCCNVNCESSADWYGSKILWQELTRTRKALKVAVSALKYIQDGNLGFPPAMDFAEKALEQITVEQKDEK